MKGWIAAAVMGAAASLMGATASFAVGEGSENPEPKAPEAAGANPAGGTNATAAALQGPNPGAPAIPLEKRSYIKNMTLLARHFPDSERWGKIQMMSAGEKRYLVQAYNGLSTPGTRLTGAVIDVTDPMRPVEVNGKAWENAFQVQVAYNADIKMWVMIVGRTAYSPRSKGLRGLEIYNLNDPARPVLLSRWSVDGGDPAREYQTGSGTHRFWYDGGRYAYLSTAPDDNYLMHEPWSADFNYAWGLQIVDVGDPTRPKLATNWHFPGQRRDEAEARAKWVFAADPHPAPYQHGPVYVPQKVEKGGKLGYGPWGSFGMVIHDLSDIANPKVVSTWTPDQPYSPGPQIAVHTVDVARLKRGFVITNPEAINANCLERHTPIAIVDVKDPANPKLISTLPLPKAPPEAPYDSFCKRYGRFGAHNPPHIKAPGTPDPNFTCYSFFNGGLQCYDIRDPRRPKIAGYFVPQQGPEGAQPVANPGHAAPWARTVDQVFIEWDRKLIWAATDNGLYLLSARNLGRPVLKPMAVKQWALPGLNEGAP